MAMVNIKDSDLYAVAGQEVSNGVIDTGLWTKAFAESGGSDQATKALYLKMRVLDLTQQRDRLRMEARAQQKHDEEMEKHYRKQLEAAKPTSTFLSLIVWIVAIPVLIMVIIGVYELFLSLGRVAKSFSG